MRYICTSIVAMLALAGTAFAQTHATGWGKNTSGQCNVPANETFVQVAAGAYHSLGLGADGTILGWGNNYYGQCNAPAGETFVQIAAGSGFSVGLRADGTILAWGNNNYGDCNVPDGSDFMQIDAGWKSVGLRQDGTAVTWGYLTEQPPPGEIFVQVSSNDHYCGLRPDGTALDWGWEDCDGNGYSDADELKNGVDTIGDGEPDYWPPDENQNGIIDFCEPPAGAVIVQVAAGGGFTVGLKDDGTVVQWGNPAFTISAGEPFAQVVAGVNFAICLRADGTALAFGDNSYGQCNVPAQASFDQVALSSDSQAHAIGLYRDSDGDGVNDGEDACPGEDDTDTDSDGTADCIDGCPEDPLKTEPGFCGCGTADTNVNGDIDCDGDYDIDDIYAGMANFGIDTGPIGACCVSSGCDPLTEESCTNVGGTWLGEGGSCDDCPATCMGDTDGNGVVDIEDLLNMIGSWGACP